MAQDHSYPGCVYFDAHIIGMVVGHPELYRPLFNFLFENHLCVAVSDALLVELGQATRKQADFNTFFTLMPSAKIKSLEAVVEDEVKSYPKTRTDASLLWPADSKVGKENITSWLIPDKIEEDRRKQLPHARKMRQCLESVNSNFPTPNLGRYNRGQAEIFAWMLTAQWLGGSHPQFMKKLNEKRRLLKAEAFPSIRLFAHYVYHKCYLGNKRPKALSDFSELFNLFYFPYCKLVVLERDTFRILSQIKSHCKVLDDVEVRNMDFFDKQILRRQDPPL